MSEKLGRSNMYRCGICVKENTNYNTDECETIGGNETIVQSKRDTGR
jgi:rRNA maturation endonuclease Nob1